MLSVDVFVKVYALIYIGQYLNARVLWCQICNVFVMIRYTSCVTTQRSTKAIIIIAGLIPILFLCYRFYY